MTWSTRWFVCAAALSGACYGEVEESPRAPLPMAAIEVSEFEDHGVELRLRLQNQGCNTSSVHRVGGSCAAWDSMKVGGQEHVLLSAGTRGEPVSGNSCSSGRSSFDEHSPPPHVWTFDVTRLPNASPREYRFDVTWEHIATLGSESEVQRTGDRRILALREDEHYVIDFVSAPPDASGCVESVALELMAEPTEPPEFRDRALRYDIWYIRTLPDGAELSAHAETIALHGEETQFRMPTVRLGPERLPLTQGGLELVLRAAGSLRGRLRTDGAIDLSVAAGVQHAVVEIGAPMTNPVYGGGQRAFRVESGQALRIEPSSRKKDDWKIIRNGDVVLTGETVRDHIDAFVITVEVD